MEGILTLNQRIFGINIKERRISKRALKASVKEVYVPQESSEITYDDGYDIDGGWFVGISVGADTCLSIKNFFVNTVTNSLDNIGMGAIGTACIAALGYYKAAAYAYLMTKINGIVSLFSLIFEFFPIIKWAAVAVGACAASILCGCIVAGSRGNSFRVGIDISWGGISGVFEM